MITSVDKRYQLSVPDSTEENVKLMISGKFNFIRRCKAPIHFPLFFLRVEIHVRSKESRFQ